jgi:hypothetical protein
VKYLPFAGAAQLFASRRKAMENLNSHPNFLTIIGAMAKYADRSTAFIAARLERMYQAHMERVQMRLAPSPMAMCTERPHVSAESDSRVGENNSQTTGSGDHFCDEGRNILDLVVIDESGSIEATGARGGEIGIGDVQMCRMPATSCSKRGRMSDSCNGGARKIHFANSL